MARVKVNPIVERISGAFGDLVFRHRNGRTILARKPDLDGYEPSSAQVAQRDRFRDAAAYAVAALEDEVLAAHYALEGERRSITPYTAAVTDALTDPAVADVDVSSFSGQASDPIHVIARPNTGVERVVVVLEDAEGSVLEAGESVRFGARWTYTLAQDVPPGTPVTVRVQASDRPGNVTEETRTVELG